ARSPTRCRVRRAGRLRVIAGNLGIGGFAYGDAEGDGCVNEEYSQAYKDAALAKLAATREAKEKWDNALFAADEAEHKYYELAGVQPDQPALVARPLSNLERFRHNDPDELLRKR